MRQSASQAIVKERSQGQSLTTTTSAAVISSAMRRNSNANSGKKLSLQSPGSRTKPGVVSEDGYPMQFSLTNGLNANKLISVACTFKSKNKKRSTPGGIGMPRIIPGTEKFY